VLGKLSDAAFNAFAAIKNGHPCWLREPKDLKLFRDSHTITKEMLQDPNSLLVAHNKSKTALFKDTVTLKVSTAPFESPLNQQGCPFLMAANALKAASDNLPSTASESKTIFENVAATLKSQSIGVTNIAFLDGGIDNQPNGKATNVVSTFWISTVNYTVTVAEEWKPDPNKPKDFLHGLLPDNKDSFVEGTFPTFAFPSDKVVKKGKYSAPATQIQYSQVVDLVFNGLIWPHISVATIVPVDDVLITSTTPIA